MPVIARPSIASLYLRMRANGRDIATGTGFLVKKDERVVYLFTNRHNVRGRRQDNDELFSATGAIPDEIAIWHNVAGKVGTWVLKSEPLYAGDEQPRWLEHPSLGPTADVVALPLTDVDGIEIADYDPSSPGPPISVSPSSPVSIVGFPFGVTAGGAFGVWVSGFLAAEHVINYNELPQFLVDSRTRPGQSGSPVVLYRDGGMVALEGGKSSVFSGPVTRFLGIYSGRINDQSDLGIVWKIEVIEEIRDNGVQGTR